MITALLPQLDKNVKNKIDNNSQIRGAQTDYLAIICCLHKIAHTHNNNIQIVTIKIAVIGAHVLQ